MSSNNVGRRSVLKLLGAAPVGGFLLSEAQAQTAHEHVKREERKGTAGAYTPKFFTPHEWATVRVLADMIIPRDEGSGSETPQ